MSNGKTDRHRILTDFGERQVSRIATRKAERADTEAGKYTTHRYYLALLLELVQIGAFLGAGVGLLLLPFDPSWDVASQAGLNIAVLLLARKGTEWCKPEVLHG